MKDLSDYQNYIGCDVSKETLDVAVFERKIDYRSFHHIRVANNLEGFRALRKWLRSEKVDLKRAVIAMEHTGLYSEAFSEWCHKQKISFVLLHAADVKNACSRGRNKNDKVDSQFIADYVYTHREKLTESEPEPAQIKRLRKLMNERRLAVATGASYKTILHGIDDKVSISRMKKMIKILDDQVKSIEKEMLTLISKDEGLAKNYALLLTVPGIGIINALSIIIATSNFTRFQTSRQYAKFICVSPIARESGTSIKGGNHTSKAGHSKLKALLTQAAKRAVRIDAQMQEYFNRKNAQGKSYGCILNAVKFKLICRMFAVIQRQAPFVDTFAFSKPKGIDRRNDDRTDDAGNRGSLRQSLGRDETDYEINHGGTQINKIKIKKVTQVKPEVKGAPDIDNNRISHLRLG